MEGSGLAARVEAASDWFKLKWIGPILMVASLVGFTIMAWGLHQNQTFDAEHATTVQGTTVDTVATRVKRPDEPANQLCWKAVVEYADSKGARHQVRGTTCFYDPVPKGTVFDVEYLDADPRKARVVGDNLLGTSLLPIVGGSVGAGLLLIGGVLTVALRKVDF